MIEDDTRPLALRFYDLPVEEDWMRTEWMLRHGVEIHGRNAKIPRPEVLKQAVERMEAWAELWGLERHGKLLFESFDCENKTALASHYKIVNLGRYTEQTRKDEREQERRRVRRLPWWKRLLGKF